MPEEPLKSLPSDAKVLTGGTLTSLPEGAKILDVKVKEEKPIETAYSKTAGDIYNVAAPPDSGVVQPWKDSNKEEGFGISALKALNSGVAALESGVLKTPGFIYDAFAAPFNYVLSGKFKEDIMALPQSTGPSDYKPLTSERFKEELKTATKDVPGAEQVIDFPKKLQDNLDAISAQVHQEQSDKYGTSISENFANGEYENGLKLLGLSVVEAVPVTASLMAGNAAGLSSTQATILGGAVFGAEKKAQLDEEFPDMPEEQKVLTSLLNGLSEGYIESSFGLTKLGGEIANVFANKGVEAGKALAKKGFEEVYLPVLKKYAGNYAEEVGSEMTTQYVQNAIDKYVGGEPDKNLFDGVIDAGLVAAGMTAPISGVAATAEAAQKKRGFKQEQAAQKEKYAERSDAAYSAVTKGKTDELKTDLSSAKESGDLSEEEYNRAVFQLDAYEKYHEQTKDLNLSKDERKEAFELSFNIEALKSEIPTNKEDIDKLDPIALAKIENKKELIKGLQKELNEIILKQDIQKETKVGQETVNKVAKTQEPAKEGQKSLDDLLKQFGGIKPEPADEINVEEELGPQKPAREKRESISNVKWAGMTALQKKQVLQEEAKHLPNNQFHVKIQEGVNGTYIGVLPDGKRVNFGQSVQSKDGKTPNYFNVSALPKNTTKIKDESGQELTQWTDDIPIKRVEIDKYDKDGNPVLDENGKPVRKAVLSAYSPETGEHIGYVREMDPYKGKYVPSNYTPKEQDQLNEIKKSNHLTDEILPFTYKPKDGAAAGQAAPKKGANVETVGETRQNPNASVPGGEIAERELTPKEKDILTAKKPNLKLDFVNKAALKGKSVANTITDEETGESLTTKADAAKVQAKIEKELKLLELLNDCIHGSK